jgi:oligopeptide/dipeptide ABC transporter ATP-binding protein
LQNKELLLEVCHLHKNFPMKKQQLHAVVDVSFHLSKGEILGIVGESGCGKSTMAKMVAGSLPVSSGTIRLQGVDYTRLQRKEKRAFRRNIQMVFQDPLSSFSPRMKIGTYLAEPRRNYDHISKKEALKEAEELLERVGLPGEFISRYPHELSGGQLQRVAIARAIAIHPALLICDEATGALDVSIQNQVAKLLVNLVEEENIGCLFIGHDLALVRNVTQRIAIMYLGRIVELIDSENLEQECCHPYTQALLNSIFDVYCDQTEEIQLLQGEPPSPLQIQSGCSFASRCPKCSEICRQNIPELKNLGKNHFVSCFRT